MILGIDPGRDKIGFALVDASATESRGALFCSGILPSGEREALWSALGQGDRLAEAFAPWLRECPNREEALPSLIALGNGTYSDALEAELRVHTLRQVLLIDERGTTLEARALYWRLHRPALWQRLLPQGLRVPPRPLDDLAAWAIALRAIPLL